MRYKLLKHYAKRQNIDVVLAPKIIKKHRQNISFYSIKDKQIHWCLELVIFGKSHICKPELASQTIKNVILKQDLFDPDVLAKYKVNLTQPFLEKYFEAQQIELSWHSYQVVSFSEQDEYKFKNQKKRQAQFQGQPKQRLLIDPDQSID